MSLWSSSSVTNSSLKDLSWDSSSSVEVELFIHMELKFLRLEFYRSILRMKMKMKKKNREHDLKKKNRDLEIANPKKQKRKMKNKGRICISKWERRRTNEKEERSGIMELKFYLGSTWIILFASSGTHI